MNIKVKQNKFIIIFLWLIIFVLASSDCQFHKGPSHEIKQMPSVLNETVILGFRPALSSGEESGVIRSPFSGAVFLAEPVPADVPDKMTNRLFARFKGREGYELISPGKAMGISAGLMSKDKGMDDIETLQKIGQAFSAEAVMLGYIYRWEERRGTDYSVDSPASVAFDLYIMRTEDGAILWKGKFDKKQAPLSENLFDLDTFFKGKGKWMKEEELAEMGLAEMFGE